MEIRLRPLRDGDFEYVISRLDDWWGGRSMTGSLPRLFFDHFPTTSRIAVDSATGDTVGFIIGFLSQGDPATAYIHFVGVDPAARGHEVGRTLYEWFFETARAAGRSTVEVLDLDREHGVRRVPPRDGLHGHRGGRLRRPRPTPHAVHPHALKLRRGPSTVQKLLQRSEDGLTPTCTHA